MSIRKTPHEVQNHTQLLGYLDTSLRGRVRGTVFKPESRGDEWVGEGISHDGTFRRVVLHDGTSQERIGVEFNPDNSGVSSRVISDFFPAQGLAITVMSRHEIPPQSPQQPAA